MRMKVGAIIFYVGMQAMTFLGNVYSKSGRACCIKNANSSRGREVVCLILYITGRLMMLKLVKCEYFNGCVSLDDLREQEKWHDSSCLLCHNVPKEQTMHLSIAQRLLLH